MRIPLGVVLSLFFFTLAETGALQASELTGGGWRGTWVDNNAGHDGPLRARFRKDASGNYRAVFTGRFRKVIPFYFATKLNVVERQGDKVHLSGESRLFGFGRFSYQGVADSSHFHSQYQSGRWTGEFNLTR